MNIQLMGVGQAGQTTSRLFGALQRGLSERGYPARYEIRNLPGGMRNRISEFKECRRVLSDASVLAIHTPLTSSILPVLAAVSSGVPVVAYVWDIHPESNLALGHMGSPLRRALYRAVERTVMTIASVVVVPSEDYLERLSAWRRKIQILPLWPSDAIHEAREGRSRDDVPLRVAFAGQINVARGLEQGVEDLRAFSGHREIELHIYSADALPHHWSESLSQGPGLKLVEHGHLAPEDLQRELSTMDCGWVCLDPAFGLPAYPSKALAYLSAGIPVLYAGPDLFAFRSWLAGAGLGVEIDRAAKLDDLDVIAERIGDARDSYFASMQERWFAPSFLTRPTTRRRSCRA